MATNMVTGTVKRERAREERSFDRYDGRSAVSVPYGGSKKSGF